MPIPKQIIDNSNVTLAQYLNEVLKECPNAQLDIATAFFQIQAYSMLKDNLQGVKKFRLLLGKSPEIQSDKTLGEELVNIVKQEVETFELSKEKEDDVQTLIDFLKKENVEVRLYDKGFLHGKAYIFDNLVIVGSSNFTLPGLTHNTELNSVGLEAEAYYTREKWFQKFWDESVDFKSQLITILENSRFGSKEFTPYEVYIKALYELQKEDIKPKDTHISTLLPESKVELTEFQQDAVDRIFSRLKKYHAVLIADSVGLGKTWIAKKIIEEFGFYRRKSFLIICPAQLREGLWKPEIKAIDLPENILSQEELATEDYLEKAQKAVGGKLDQIELVVVDESHNLRNPLSNRWENFFTLIHDHISAENKRPYILFLTATPINNTIWDLFWQLMLLVNMDRGAFLKEGINDLFKFFKDVAKKEDPSLLNDLLNEISIRRTRDYIIKNYPDATIKGKKITFPKRKLDNIDYHLDKTYKGMYREFADIITEQLTMAYYRLLKYKKQEKLTAEEEWALNRMIALEGIFRTLLLKRLESSVQAFRISISNHIGFLERLKKCLAKGKTLTKQTLNRQILFLDEEISQEFLEELEDFEKDNYRMDDLFADINKDINLLRNKVLSRISTIKPEEDAKLNKLKKDLIDFHKKGQIILFTYYTDTLDYLYENLTKTKELSALRIVKISGSTGTRERDKIVKDFLNGRINILISTDVLSEGMNLQSAKIIINYDLHWNPTRMIQRAGRIDRIGSPYPEIYVYNFFPEDELEELLRLVQILQTKIINIDKSVGLDQTILGEEIHPKVFGIIRKIREKDTTIFELLEKDMFGGGEKFYQPLKDFLRTKAIEELEALPYGIHSGLQNKKILGIFFYYKYADDLHLWYLYDVATKEILKNKTQIIDFIACQHSEARVIPDFFDLVYEVNKKVAEDVELSYKEMEQVERVDTQLGKITRDRSMVFIKQIIGEIERNIDDYLMEFREEKEIVTKWEATREKLLSMPHTKKRLRLLRKLWREYKQGKDWKTLVNRMEKFVSGKTIHRREPLPPFDKSKLKLVVLDFIS
jgi:superfamily II DNA or RNA helicase/sulfur relay (sulfurtransferase) DsrC/TusE family protein